MLPCERPAHSDMRNRRTRSPSPAVAALSNEAIAEARREAFDQIKRTKHLQVLQTHYNALEKVLRSYVEIYEAEIEAAIGREPVREALETSYDAIAAAVHNDPHLMKELEVPLNHIAEAFFQTVHQPPIATVWWALHREKTRVESELFGYDKLPLAREDETLLEATRRVLIERGASSYAAVRATGQYADRVNSRALPQSETRTAQRQAERARKQQQMRLRDARRNLRSAQDSVARGKGFGFASYAAQRYKEEIAMALEALKRLSRPRKKPNRRSTVRQR